MSQERKGSAMSIIGIIFFMLFMVAFAMLINSLNIQDSIKHIIWFVESIMVLMFLVLILML